MRVKLCLPSYGKTINRRRLKTECLGEYLDLERKEKEAGGNTIMNLSTCHIRQILLRWSDQGRCEGYVARLEVMRIP
jgi:hypothetical protein